MTSFNFKKWNLLSGWFVFFVALITYTLTVEPTMSFWDCGEYIATAAKLQVGHPPGAPLYQMMGAFFAMFATSAKHVALMVNMMSVFSSAFTILLMFWSLVKIMKKIILVNSDFDENKQKIALVASFIASLSYTFTDSFWFNAVEAEVYAMASLFIALLFWLGLKWEEEMDEPKGNKWLVLISLVVGLSFGVHFMALLTIPSIGLLYYFKKVKTITVKSFIIANVAIIAVLMFIFKFLLPYTLALFGKAEIFMVNSFGLPFNSGTILVFFLIVGLFTYGLKITKTKGLVHYNTLILCVLFLFIGFSTWIMLPIRANSNVNINENKPSDAAEVLAYYNREQYGEQKLFYGPQYSVAYAGLDADVPYLDDKPNYERDEHTGKYVVVNNFKNAKQNFDQSHNTFLPRMWSEEHIKNYAHFTKPLEFRVNPEAFVDDEGTANEEDMSQMTEIVSDFRTAFHSGKVGLDEYDEFLKTYGDYLIIEKPSFSDNMKFMFEYQFGYMYVRYLLWNFVGRQNDIQGNYEDLEGNWLSGIKIIDEIHIGNQDDLPSDLTENKGRNVYYFLPFLLAIIGMYYHAKNEWKSFFVLLMLFLFTGLALKIYLNERPFEPRERDYALVGSFYVFAMWIAVGIYAIYEKLLSKWDAKKSLITVALVSFFASPFLLAKENWDDHDRSGKYTAVAMAKSYLDSCEPNAILFTIGDNDTFPLWYLQEIEGYRTDVRIVNTSLLATDWYIDEMKVASNKSKPLPISFEHSQYVGDKRNYCVFVERTKDTLDLKDFMKFVKFDDKRAMQEMKSGQFVNFYPSEHLKLDIDKKTIIENKVVSSKYYDSIVPQMKLKLRGGAIYKNRMIMLDILNENNWKRPIYFSPGSYGADDYIWLKEYLQLDGMVYKLVPVQTKITEENQYDMGYIDTDKMFDIVSKWDWGNSGSTKIYHDPETRRNALSYRRNLARLVDALIEDKKMDKALKIVDITMNNLPKEYYDYYSTLDPFVNAYYKLNKPEKAKEVISFVVKKYQEKIKYFSKLKQADKQFYRTEIYRNLSYYRSVLDIARENGDLNFYTAELARYNNYNTMMGSYKLEEE